MFTIVWLCMILLFKFLFNFIIHSYRIIDFCLFHEIHNIFIIFKDSIGKSSTDLNEDKSKHPEEVKGISGELETTTKSSELRTSELDAGVGSTQTTSETDEKHSGGI